MYTVLPSVSYKRVSINDITSALGPKAVSIIKQAFFQLDSMTLNSIFYYYGALYGAGAGNYARNTYFAWKNKLVSPSGKTYQRVLEIAPYFLSNEDKSKITQAAFDYHCKNLRKTREHYTINPDCFESQIEEVKQIISKDRFDELPKDAFDLPTNVYQYVNWFLASDAAVLKKISLAYSTERQKLLIQGALIDLNNFIYAYNNIKKSSEYKLDHTFELLTVDVTISITKEKPWYLKLPGWVYVVIAIFLWFKLCD